MAEGKIPSDIYSSELSLNPIPINGTYTIPEEVMKHTILIIYMSRYGRSGSVVIPTYSDVSASIVIHTGTTQGYLFKKVGNTITLLDRLSSDTAEPYIRTIGIL